MRVLKLVLVLGVLAHLGAGDFVVRCSKCLINIGWSQEQIQDLKKHDPEAFATIMDDDNNYSYEATSYAEEHGIKSLYIDPDTIKRLIFPHATITLHGSEFYLYKVGSKPKKIQDITFAQQEIGAYFHLFKDSKGRTILDKVLAKNARDCALLRAAKPPYPFFEFFDGVHLLHVAYEPDKGYLWTRIFYIGLKKDAFILRLDGIAGKPSIKNLEAVMDVDRFPQGEIVGYPYGLPVGLVFLKDNQLAFIPTSIDPKSTNIQPKIDSTTPIAKRVVCPVSLESLLDQLS